MMPSVPISCLYKYSNNDAVNVDLEAKDRSSATQVVSDKKRIRRLLVWQKPPKLQQKRVQPPKDETPSPRLSPEEAGRRERTQLFHGESEGNSLKVMRVSAEGFQLCLLLLIMMPRWLEEWLSQVSAVRN
ncbi:hypothetical protein Bca101_022485 [Brassica carinata]